MLESLYDGRELVAADSIEKLVWIAGFGLLYLGLYTTGVLPGLARLVSPRLETARDWPPSKVSVVFGLASFVGAAWFLGQLRCVICWGEVSSPWALVLFGLWGAALLLRRVIAEWLVTKGFAVDSHDVFVTACYVLVLAVVFFVAAMWLVSS